MNELNLQARNSGLKKLSQDWAAMLKLGGEVSTLKIQFVNLGREIGLGLQGLCGHEQMKLSFFENIKEQLPKGFTFFSAQRCIQIAHALPEPATTISEAVRVEVQLLFGCGLLDVPHREEAQQQHSRTPDTEVFSILASATDKLFKQFKTVAEWDAETRESISQQVEKFERLLAEIKSQLAV